MSVDCLKRRRYAALVGLGRPRCPAPTRWGTRHVWGTKAKPSSVGAPTALLFVRPWSVSRPTGPLKPSIAFRSDRWLDCKLPRCQFEGDEGGRRQSRWLRTADGFAV